MLHQTWFDEKDVLQALRDAGLEELAVYDRAELLGKEPTGGKMVYTARKRLRPDQDPRTVTRER